MDKELIAKQAKEIMDSFSSKLASIDLNNDFELIREKSFREEGNGKEIDEDFIQRFLNNAPKISGNAILSKKGEWIE